MKKCNECNQLKTLSEFHRDKSKKDNHHHICKTCRNLKALIYRRSKKGLITQIYSDQKKNSKKRNHAYPNYTMHELRQWIFNQKIFIKLYNNWVNSGYIIDLVPSCDRLDDYKPYTLDNLRLVTFKENRESYYQDAKNGINTKRCKPVIQYSLDGIYIKEYYSIIQASRDNNIKDTHIINCCKGIPKIDGKGYFYIPKTAGGFIWRYKDPL